MAWNICLYNISDIKSLDFTVTRFLMKLFKSSKINLINESRVYFDFQLPSELLIKIKDKFIEKVTANQSVGLLCLSVNDMYCHIYFV